jgi:subtilase family serine protease
MLGQTVSLQPGETKTVGFTFVPTVAKQYSVTVDGLTGSFTASPVPVSDIRVTNLNISPASCYVGDTVTMTVTVKNFGTAAGSRDIVLNVA